MMALTKNQILIGIFASGTLAGVVGSATTSIVARSQLALPEDAELIDPSTGIVTVEEDGEAVVVVANNPAPRRMTKKTLVDPILRRNMFDSSKVGGVVTEEEDGDSGNKTSLPIVLLATVLAEPETFSSALIAEEKGEDGAMGYGIGDSILGEATIHRIEQKRVILKRSDGEFEYLAMDDTKIASTPKNSKSAKAGKAGKWAGVEKQGGNKFTIDEETFNKALENPQKLANQIRAVPDSDESGKVVGYRLSGIRRSSLFNKLGIRNGDVVHSVNGNGLSSVQSAMSAYESLQNERNFSFEITRRNKKQTFEYEVR
ncbi:MAG: hypothetical protein CL930_07095 [Deltaproteobacteria bacterium]|nr:hypothetical protein [Deltaproteobacteria bacterium]